MENVIKELNNTNAFRLIQALDSAQTKHVTHVRITEDGIYHFTEGNEHTVQKELDPKNDVDAALLKAGKKYRKVKLPGLYIGSKKIIKEYSREEIFEKRADIVNAFRKEEKERRRLQKAANGEEDMSVDELAESLRAISDKMKPGTEPAKAPAAKKKETKAPTEPAKA